MKRTRACVFCGGANCREEPALLAPFIRERALSGSGPEQSLFLACDDCGGGFFADRFDEAEVLALYRDYRGEAYVETRKKHEFWYTEELNRGPAGFSEARRAFVDGILARHGFDASGTDAALDFGGDTGELFPDALPRERCWVVEPSGVLPRPPLRSVRSLEELGEGRFGLVLAAQVFEHLSEPRTEIARLAARVEPGGLLYIEVPDERVFDFSLPRMLQTGYLRLLARFRLARLAAEVWSLAGRSLGVLPPLGFRKLHEHVNVLSEEALRRLAPDGFDVEASSETLRVGSRRTKLLVAVYRRRGDR